MTARLPALDGLRAVAALLVVATHAAYLSGFTVNGGLVGRLAGRGDFGVAVFFALSGFLLHFRLVSDARDGQTDVKAYAVRRAARVLPAYWVTLAVVVAVTQPPVRTAVAQAFTVQTYLPGADIDAFSQSWSIPTELSFYVVLPLVVWLLERARHRDQLPDQTRWVRLRGCGHVPMVDDPEVTAALLLQASDPATAPGLGKPVR
jgi:peptidoglycan/LPS O-acetylase OafA/YrhL